MSVPFPPQTDSGLRDFAANLAAKASLSDGLSPGQQLELSAANSAYAAALATATAPATRTRPTILAKDAARKTLLSVVRKVARIINANPAVTNERRAELGLTVRKTPAPIPPPSAILTVDVVSVSGSTFRVRLHGEPVRTAKPDGVAGAQIFSFTGETAPSDLTLWRQTDPTTRTEAYVTVDDAAPGALVWLVARWFNAKMEFGPLSEPVSARVQWAVGNSSPQALRLAEAA
ncbi:MAG: hypothetical protein IT446_13900 [Phycisphaerales bacterium]|nr:hypothetical protein [Phycisphaerales bacterium]